MFTSMLSNIEILLPSATGTSIPHMVISVSKPTVFSSTVLPPVLGPVMMSVS